jgi:hypothetical protein
MPIILLKLCNTERFDDEEVGKLCNEVIMVYRKAVLHNLTGSTEENLIAYQDIKVGV